MKKIMFLLMFSIVLISTSCEKDDAEPQVNSKTFEQMYPDFKNLTFISTVPVQPLEKKWSMKIVGDVITVTSGNMYGMTNIVYKNMKLINTVGNPITSGGLLLWNDTYDPRSEGNPFEINRATNTIKIYFDGYVVNLKIN